MRPNNFLFPIVAIACTTVGAQEVGQVRSSTPVIQQVSYPQQVCTQESVVVPGAPQGGGGAVIGAIAGAAIGNAVGHGPGRAASTVLGMIGGAAIGQQIDSQHLSSVQQLSRCTTHTLYENRVTHYDVVYEYAGRSYAVQMPSDPGATVLLQITPMGATQGVAPQTAPAGIYRSPVITSYDTIVSPQPYYEVSRSPVFIALPVYPFAMAPQHRHGHHGGGHRQQRHGASPYPRQGGQLHWR